MFEFQILRYEGNDDYEDFTVELDGEELFIQYDSIAIPRAGTISLKFKLKETITGVSFSTDLLSQMTTQYLPIASPVLLIDCLSESVKSPRILITNLNNDDSIEDDFTNPSFNLYQKFVNLKKEYATDINALKSSLKALEFELLQTTNEGNIEKALKEDKIEELEMSEHRNNVIKVNMESIVKDIDLQRNRLEMSLEKECYTVAQLDKFSKTMIKECENYISKSFCKENELNLSISDLVKKIESLSLHKMELEQMLENANRQNEFLQQTVSIEKLRNSAKKRSEEFYFIFKDRINLEHTSNVQVIIENYEELYNNVLGKFNRVLRDGQVKDKILKGLKKSLEELELKFEDVLSRKRLKINNLKQDLLQVRIEWTEKNMTSGEQICSLEEKVKILNEKNQELETTLEENSKQKSLIIEEKDKIIEEKDKIIEMQRSEFELQKEILENNSAEIKTEYQGKVDDLVKKITNQEKQYCDLEAKSNFLAQSFENKNQENERKVDALQKKITDQEKKQEDQCLDFEVQTKLLGQKFEEKSTEYQKKIDNLQRKILDQEKEQAKQCKEFEAQIKLLEQNSAEKNAKFEKENEAWQRKIADHEKTKENQMTDLTSCKSRIEELNGNIKELQSDFESKLLTKSQEYEQIILNSKKDYLQLENESYQKDSFICNLTNENSNLENALIDAKEAIEVLNSTKSKQTLLHQKEIEEMTEQSYQEKLTYELTMQGIADKFEKEKAVFEKKVEEYRVKMEELKKNYEKKLGTEKRNSEESHKLLEHEMTCVKSDLKSLEKDNETLRNNLSVRGKEFSLKSDEFENERNDLKKEIFDREKAFAEAEKRLKKELREGNRMNEDLIRKLKEEFENEKNELNSRVASLSSEMSMLTNLRFKEFEEYKIRVKELNDNTEKKLSEKEEKITGLHKKISDLASEIAELKAKIDENTEIFFQEKNKLLKDLEDTVKKSEKNEQIHTEKYEKVLEKLNSEVKVLKSGEIESSSLVKKLRWEIEGLTSELNQINSKLLKNSESFQREKKETTNELLKLKEKSEALLTQQYQCSLKSLNSEIILLRAEKKSIELEKTDKITSLQSEISSLYSSLDKLNSTLVINTDLYQREKEKLLADLSNLKEKSEKKEISLIQDHQNSLDLLDSEIKLLKMETKSLIKEKSGLEIKISELIQEFNIKEVSIKEEFKNSTISKDIFSNVKTGFEEKINSLQNIILLLEQKNKKLLAELADLRENFATLTQKNDVQIEKLSVKTSEFEKFKSETSEKMQSLLFSLEFKENALMRTQSFAQSYFSNLQDLFLRNSELDSEKSSLFKKTSYLIAKLKSSQALLENLHGELFKTDQKYQSLILNFNKSQETITNLKSVNSDNEALINDLTNKLHYVMEECKQHSQSFSELSSKNNSLEEAVSYLRNNIKQKSEEIENLESLVLSTKEDKKNSTKELLNILSSNNPTDPETIDKMLSAYLVANNTANNFIRIADGVYSHKNKKVGVCIRNGGLVIRVGGGYMYIDEFLKQYVDEITVDGCTSTIRRVLDVKKAGIENITEECVFDFSNPINGLKSLSKTPVKRFN